MEIIFILRRGPGWMSKNLNFWGLMLLTLKISDVLSMKMHFEGRLVTYRKISNIRRTKSKNLNDSRLVLHLSLPNLLKPGV